MKNNIHDIVDQIYCINMPIYKDRLKFMQEQSDLYNLDIEFYNAIDFAQFFNTCRTNYLNFILDNFDFPVWHRASQQFGCLFSHYSVVKNAYLLGLNKIIVLEDDVCFYKDILKFYEILYKIPNDTDFARFEQIFKYMFIKLEDNPYIELPVYNDIKNDMNKSDYIKFNNYYKYNPFNFYCMGFYYMNRKMMEKYINYIENMEILPKLSDNLLWIINEDINFYYSSISLGIQQSVLNAPHSKFISKDFNENNYNIPEQVLTQMINYNKCK